MAHSSTDSEHKAVADSAVEVKWLQSLLYGLKFNLPQAPIMIIIIII